MEAHARRIVGIAVLAVLCVSPSAQAAAVGPLGLDQRTLVICVRYTDAPTTRMARCSDWVALLGAETNLFYRQATFDQTSFGFETISGPGAPADGWLDLGYASSGYDFARVGQDAIRLADPHADFRRYDRVLVITNWPGFGGQGGGPWWWAVSEGAEATVTPLAGGSPVPSRLMTLANTNEWLPSSFGSPFDEAASVMAHELGHQLGVPTHYGSLAAGGSGRDTITPWDIMGLSPTLNHFLGYPKVQRGWIPTGPRIVTIGPPAGAALDQTVRLRPLERATTSPQVIRIPLSASGPFIGYMVENRQQIDGDQRLPSGGVLLSAVDESPHTAIRAWVLDDPSHPLDLNQAPLEVGESFSDPARNLTVSVLGQSGTDYDVRVQYAPPTTSFDPAITPWGAPPWETPDIWIDSERNAFGVYRYTDSAGHPVGNGDDAWVNRDNRVYVRVHNYGTGIATNVRVQVFVNSPPGMGDAGPDWAFLGTILLPSIGPGGQASGFVNWRPTVGAHTCIKAVIVDSPGELLTTNNLAQENVSHFDTSAGSPYQAVQLAATVYNPFDEELPVRIHVRDVPYGWAVVTDPPEMRIPPRGRHPVHVAVYPSGWPPRAADGSAPPTPPAGGQGGPCDRCPPPVEWDREQLAKTTYVGFIGRPKVEAQMPYYDTFIPIGGIDLWTHLTRRTTLTCQVDGADQTAPRPAFPGAEGAGLLPPPGKGEQEYSQKAGKPQPVDPTQLYELGPIVLRPDPDPRVQGGTVVLTGRLTPAVGGALIAVEVGEGEARKVHFAETDAEGGYRVKVEASYGRTVARAFFDGDAEHATAQSGFCAFVVEG